MKHTISCFLIVLASVAWWGTLRGAASSEGEVLETKIIHVPVNALRENEKLVVEARVDGATAPVVYVRLYFKSKWDASYDYIEMRRDGAGYFGELPPSYFSPPEVHYFILALLEDHTVVTYPSWNPFGKPVVVSVASREREVREATPVVVDSVEQNTDELIAGAVAADEPSGDLEAEGPLLVLSPEPNEEFAVGEEVVVAVSFVPDEEEIDVQSVNIFVDGMNVTLEAEISEFLLTYATTQLEPGRHHVLVQGHYASGAQLPTVQWSFRVVGAQRRRSESPVRGRIFAESRQERISDVPFVDNNIGGHLYGRYGPAAYDARVYFTSREDKRFQPRNRYSFSFDLPIIGATFGDTYPRFNDLMLWGTRVRGIHGRLRLGGVFNLDVIHGETVRRVSAEHEFVLSATGDTLQTVTGSDSTQVVNSGVHRRTLLGIRQSWGSGRTFQLGFNLLKVRDDTTSLKDGEYSLPPQDNLVIGSDLLISLAQRRFELRASVATSLLSTDISSGPASKQEIEDTYDTTLPFDPADWAKWFIINTSTTPLDPSDLTSLAYHINLRWQILNNDLQVGYKSVGSEYMSLANSFLRTNIRGFYIYDRIRLFQNRVYLNLGFEDFNDNFDRVNDSPSTRLRTINSGLSFFPAPGLPNVTVSFRNHLRDNQVDTLTVDPVLGDTTDVREYTVSKDLTVQLSQDVRFFQTRSSVTLSYVASNRDDRFGTTRLDGINLAETASNVGLVSVRTQYQIPLITTFDFARNKNDYAGGQNTFEFSIVGGRAEYQFFNRRLRAHVGLNTTTASGQSVLSDTTLAITDYNRLDFNFGARFEMAPGHSFLFEGHLIRFDDKGGTFSTASNSFIQLNPSYRDYIFRFYYEKRL